MREPLVAAPPWRQALLAGAIVGCAYGIGFGHAEHLSWPRGVVSAVVCGALYALISWSVLRARRRPLEQSMSALSRDQRRAAYRAAADGRAPDDPAVARAAVAIARDTIDRSTRRQGLATVVVGAALVATVSFTAADASAWVAAALAALGVVMLVEIWWAPARTRHRLARLTEDPAS